MIRSISTKVNGICLWRRRQVLPGFGLTLGFALLYLCLLVLLPLSAAFLKASGLGWDGFIRAVTSPRVVASFGVSVRASAAVAVTMLVLSFLLLLIINLLQRWSVRWLARWSQPPRCRLTCSSGFARPGRFRALRFRARAS